MGGMIVYIFVEERIKESINNGDFKNLPGKGKPLDLKDDFPNMSPELKQAYKILKQAGYITTDVDKKNNISQRDLLTIATDGAVNDEFEKRKHFNTFVKERSLHQSPKFTSYAKKIFNKLF